MTFLEFEQPVIELEEKIRGLRSLPTAHQLKIQDEIERLEKKSRVLLRNIYKGLTPWQRVLVARHIDRPKTREYIQRAMQDFIPLSGDRKFSDDAAVLGGLARFRGRSVVVIGHDKGHDIKTRVQSNFGMAHPEGYRKAIRLMDLADRFGLPVITLVDTPGAYAGTGAEERGQFEAIAACIEKGLSLSVPSIAVIIGEGGSGGAVAFSSTNVILMLENSVYSVISPEGAAAIVWRTADKKEEGAAALKLTARDLLEFGVIDQIISEPLGGAHRNKIAVIDAVADAVEAHLCTLEKQDHLPLKRREKFLAMGRILPH